METNISAPPYGICVIFGRKDCPVRSQRVFAHIDSARVSFDENVSRCIYSTFALCKGVGKSLTGPKLVWPCSWYFYLGEKQIKCIFQLAIGTGWKSADRTNGLGIRQKVDNSNLASYINFSEISRIASDTNPPT